MRFDDRLVVKCVCKERNNIVDKLLSLFYRILELVFGQKLGLFTNNYDWVKMKICYRKASFAKLRRYEKSWLARL